MGNADTENLEQVRAHKYNTFDKGNILPMQKCLQII